MALAALAAGGYASHDAGPEFQRTRLLRAFAPGLEPEMARHLACDSDPEWLDHCRRIGTAPLADASGVLGTELRTDSYVRFLERREILEQALMRIAIGYAQVFALTSVEVHARRAMALPAKQDFEVRQLERRYIDAETAPHPPPDQRIRLCDSLAHEFQSRGEPARAISASLVACRLELVCRRDDRHRARLEAVIRMSRRHGEAYVVCQTLGELAMIHRREGHEDSMRVCFDEGIATARRHGLLDQAARFLQFEAADYARQGRMSMALDRLAEAQRICEQAGGEASRLRLQIAYAKLMAEFDCWDLVDRSVRRLPPLLRDFSRIGRVADIQKYAFDADRLRARLSFANGDTTTGSQMMKRWSDAMPPGNARAGFAELFDEWSAGLEESGQPDRALEICERGISHCDTANVPTRGILLKLRRARLLESLGRLGQAVVALDSAETYLKRHLAQQDGVEREIDVHRARLSFRLGETTAARLRIERILRQFRAQLREGDDDIAARLNHFDAAALRDAVHEIEGFTPEAGYRFELEWRSMSREPRNPSGPHTTATRPGTSRGPRPVAGTHLVYRFTRDVLLRWTAARGRVALDTLPITARQSLTEVREALRLLQTEPARPGQILGPEASRRLLQLSAALLPPSLWTSEPHPMLLSVSADGPLLALPFEALPAAGPRGLQPLARWADVVYVRGWGGDSKPSGGPAVIVSDPMLSPELKRRHGWTRGLAGSEAESRAVKLRWPHAVLLSGEGATKDAIQAHWPGASIIYLATHHLRDPDAPFLGFVPLAAPQGATASADFLEVADVRSLDLSACRLAVLASCSSGVPYRLTIRPGPSLGDAFFDAGAHSVVQSFWDVRDEETREFMKVFLTNWREDEDDAAALGRARREVMSTPRGASPRVWAAWSVHRLLRAGASSAANAK